MTTNCGTKKLKTAPACSNIVKLYKTDAYTLYWKGRAAPKRKGASKPAKPRPKDWANLVVFMHDPSKRARSFHISWNGGRFGTSPQFDRFAELEPDALDDLEERLPSDYSHIVKPW
jgi:hypothetical protein